MLLCGTNSSLLISTVLLKIVKAPEPLKNRPHVLGDKELGISVGCIFSVVNGLTKRREGVTVK